MFLCLLQFLIICFLIPSTMNEVELNIFHSSVCHGSEFTLMIKVMDLIVNVFLLRTLSGLGS